MDEDNLQTQRGIFKLTTSQKSQILNDVNVRKIKLDTIFDRFTKDIGSNIKKAIVRSEIIKVISGYKRKKYISLEKYKVHAIGSKKEAYFENENSYGTVPNYSLEEMIEENPNYERQDDLGTSSRISSFNDNYNDIIRNGGYDHESEGSD